MHYPSTQGSPCMPRGSNHPALPVPQLPCRLPIALPPAYCSAACPLLCRLPIALPPDSEPEPDFAIVGNRADDYVEGHPQPADILWLIEVSDSSKSSARLPTMAKSGSGSLSGG
ncbi:MAG: hypothetical protein AAFP03_10380, partial [Cyanobacteria bacterium J06598_3]